MEYQLTVQKRPVPDKKPNKLREEGFIPAELYGKEIDNIHVAVSKKDFNKIYQQAGANNIVNLKVDGSESVPVLIYDIQYNPVSHEKLAIDFYKIKEDEEIQTDVPFDFIGEAPATKKDCVVVKVIDSLEIEVLPLQIPPKIEVDLSMLEKEGDVIHVKDLNIPDGVKLLVPEDAVVVSISKIEEEVEEIKPLSVDEALSELGEQTPENGDQEGGKEAPVDEIPEE